VLYINIEYIYHYMLYINVWSTKDCGDTLFYQKLYITPLKLKHLYREYTILSKRICSVVKCEAYFDIEYTLHGTLYNVYVFHGSLEYQVTQESIMENSLSTKGDFAPVHYLSKCKTTQEIVIVPLLDIRLPFLRKQSFWPPFFHLVTYG
jgi:hypothetical protein